MYPTRNVWSTTRLHYIHWLWNGEFSIIWRIQFTRRHPTRNQVSEWPMGLLGHNSHNGHRHLSFTVEDSIVELYSCCASTCQWKQNMIIVNSRLPRKTTTQVGLFVSSVMGILNKGILIVACYYLGNYYYIKFFTSYNLIEWLYLYPVECP